jgi:ankyrin repeat protein
VKNEGPINPKEGARADEGVTPLHFALTSGDLAKVRTLLESGSDANARDAFGRTPLLLLAGQLEWFESLEEGLSAGLEALKALVEHGADASLTDNFGNGPIMYYEYECSRNQTPTNPAILQALSTAGASGSGATGRLFDSIGEKDVEGVKAAIKDDADVNRVCPPPTGGTPLMQADSEAMVDALLQGGADVNKGGCRGTPLLQAALRGRLGVVKRLVAAGANIHAVEEHGKFRRNAYLAAQMNRKHDVADYLKSLGAGMPAPAETGPLKPGVGSWNDFSEILVKADAETTANALALMIGGEVQSNVYGQSLKPGEKAYVVVHAAGSKWSNVFQVAPPPRRFPDQDQVTAFAVELSRTRRAPVLWVAYSDTSGTGGVARFEPNGEARNAGESMSREQLVRLAEEEGFVVAKFGPNGGPGGKVEVEFSGHVAGQFDGVAFVNS